MAKKKRGPGGYKLTAKENAVKVDIAAYKQRYRKEPKGKPQRDRKRQPKQHPKGRKDKPLIMGQAKQHPRKIRSSTREKCQTSFNRLTRTCRQLSPERCRRYRMVGRRLKPMTLFSKIPLDRSSDWRSSTDIN